MHAQRYDHEDEDEALDAAPRIDVSRRQRQRRPRARRRRPISTGRGRHRPRGPSRRAWITAAIIAATLSLGAFAWTRPHTPAQTAAAPAVTAVELRRDGHGRARRHASQTALLVIPDDGPRRRGRVHGAHARGAESSPEPVAAAPSSDEAPASEAVPSDPRERHHGRIAANAESEAREAREAVEAAAPRATPSRSLATREPPATQEPQAQEATGEEETEATLPTDSADEVVERAVGAHSEAIERCIDAAEDEAEGRVTVHLVIARDGAVRSATPQGPGCAARRGQVHRARDEVVDAGGARRDGRHDDLVALRSRIERELKPIRGRGDGRDGGHAGARELHRGHRDVGARARAHVDGDEVPRAGEAVERRAPVPRP